MERKIYIDLHTHTNYSDGIGTPDFNVRLARLSALDYIAITDHDKIDGYYEAKAAGEKWQLGIIPGVEVSTDLYHILGLGINPESKSFREFLDFSAEEQKKVCQKRIRFFRELGVPISLEKVLEAFPHSRLGKFNVLMTMDQDEACQRYFMEKYGTILTKDFYDGIIKGCSDTDKKTLITPVLAIKEIHNAGGVAIIAHPFKDIKSIVEIDTLRMQGLDGIEVQPNYKGKNAETKAYAEKNNMLITYGSDFHGGLFGRAILTNAGENILSEELADALKLNIREGCLV